MSRFEGWNRAPYQEGTIERVYTQWKTKKTTTLSTKGARARSHTRSAREWQIWVIMNGLVVGDFNKNPNLKGLEITFSKKEARRLRHPHTDALMVTLPIANINLHIILIDTDNWADIMFSKAWKAMKLTHLLSTMKTPLVGFSEASMTTKRYIALSVTM